MRLYTIGFTHKTAEYCFSRLRRAGIRTLVDVRLHNTSQLAGFTKKEDLPFFVRELCKAAYLHLPGLAPSEELFHARKKEKMTWQAYEKRYLALLRSRAVEDELKPANRVSRLEAADGLTRPASRTASPRSRSVGSP